jgi:hypothetical protein
MIADGKLLSADRVLQGHDIRFDRLHARDRTSDCFCIHPSLRENSRAGGEPFSAGTRCPAAAS